MIIDNVNFYELETQKYWSFPKSYKKDSKAETKDMIFSGNYIGAKFFTNKGAKILRPIIISVLVIFLCKILIENFINYLLFSNYFLSIF